MATSTLAGGTATALFDVGLIEDTELTAEAEIPTVATALFDVGLIEDAELTAENPIETTAVAHDAAVTTTNPAATQVTGGGLLLVVTTGDAVAAVAQPALAAVATAAAHNARSRGSLIVRVNGVIAAPRVRSGGTWVDTEVTA